MRAQEGKGARHDDRRQYALVRRFGFNSVDEIIGEEGLEFTLIGKVGQRGKEGCGFDRRVVALFQQRQGQRQGRPGDAIAHDVDPLLFGDRLHLFDRGQIALLNVILHADIGIAGIRVDPRHDEQRVALINQPFDEAVLGLEVKNVELVDPRREDQQRGFVNLIGAGRVLDQLEHAVAEHHFARGGGDVTAKLKGAVVRQLDHQFTIVRFQIRDQVLQTFDKALALGLYRAFKHIRVGGQKIRRRHHRDDLLGKIDQTVLFGRVHVGRVFNGLAQGFGINQVLLLDETEIGMRLPKRIGKALVFGRLILRCSEITLSKRFLGLYEMGDRLCPIAHLMFHQSGRIRHRLGPIRLRGFGEKLLIWRI